MYAVGEAWGKVLIQPGASCTVTCPDTEICVVTVKGMKYMMKVITDRLSWNLYEHHAIGRTPHLGTS